MSFRGSRLTLGLLTGLVVVLVSGTGAAIVVSHQRQPTVAIATEAPRSRSTGSSLADASQTASPSTESAGSPAAEPGASTAAEPAATLKSTSNSTTAAGGPSNNLTVQMSSSVARSAHAAAIQQLLQGYFDAINQHNYTGWAQSVTSKLAGQQTSAQWLQAYATTVDSSIWIQSMNDDPLQVRVRFTSQQDPDLAPKDLPAGCIEWAITYRIESDHAHLAIGSTLPGSVSKAKC